MKESENKIDYRFKILYAIAMLAVIAGHCSISCGGVSFFYEWFTPYAFHLPLFVFVSGYFYKSKNEENPLKYIIKKAKRLLIPLYLWNLFYGIFMVVLQKNGFTYMYTYMPGCNILDIKDFIYMLIVMPINNGHQFLFNMGGWFVIPLFMLEVFNVLFRKAQSFVKIKSDKIKDIICFITYLLLGFVCVYISTVFTEKYWLVLVILRFLYFLPFYGLGMVYKSILEKYEEKIDNYIYFSIIFGIQLVILLLWEGNFPVYTPSWQKGFGIIWPYLLGLTGIAFWLRVAKILEPAIGKSKTVNLIADNTYTIMINHFMGFFMFNTAWAILAKLKICNSFVMSEYKSNIWYFYYPKGVTHFGIIYLVAGVVIPIIMQKIVNYVYGLIKTKFNKKVTE